MAEQTPRTSPDLAQSLGRTLFTVAAASPTSAAVLWSALFDSAAKQQRGGRRRPTARAQVAPSAEAAPLGPRRSRPRPHENRAEHQHSFDLRHPSAVARRRPGCGAARRPIAALRVQALSYGSTTRSRASSPRASSPGSTARGRDRPGVEHAPRRSRRCSTPHRSATAWSTPRCPPDRAAGYAHSRVGLASADLATAIAAAPERRSAGAHPAGTWRAIDLDAAAGTLRVPAGVRLDLGGSAKGMAVDIAARMLADSPAFAVDAGGDIRLGGTDPAPRAVRIEHPLTGEIAHEFVPTSAAIATSGLRTRVWRTAGRLCAPPHRSRAR